MKITNKILSNLNEKAEIDWNNYLTSEQVKHMMNKDDKTEAAEDIIYSKDFDYYCKRFSDPLQKKYNNAWTKDELVQDLARFYINGHLITESSNRLDLWKRQIDNKDNSELKSYLNKLYRDLSRFNTDNSDIKSTAFYDLLDKINYIEDKIGIRPKLGRVLR